MSTDPFTERLARVRHRYVSTIEGKIDDTYADLPKLVGDGPTVAMTLTGLPTKSAARAGSRL
jgi:hypothetical protein